MNEKKMFETLKAYQPAFHQLRSSSEYDQYCCYDAETPNYVIEFKARRKYFPTTQLEKQKYDKLMKEDREALYCVYSHGYIHIFCLNQLQQQGYDFRWTTRMCPATTDFNNNKKVPKVVGEICWKQAKARIKV